MAPCSVPLGGGCAEAVAGASPSETSPKKLIWVKLSPAKLQQDGEGQGRCFGQLWLLLSSETTHPSWCFTDKCDSNARAALEGGKMNSPLKHLSHRNRSWFSTVRKGNRKFIIRCVLSVIVL